MKEFSVAMALVDYIPVALFAVASVILMRDLYNKMSKGAFALFAAGTIDAIFAGVSKVTYKFLYAAGICDFEALNNVYFPVISVGFLLAGIGLIGMVSHKQTESSALCLTAPAAFKGTAIMVSFMIVGLAMIYSVLCILAHKLKKPMAIVLLVLSFACSLSMGYLSSKDFTSAYWNWIAEAINIVGQGLLLGSAVMLRKAGLNKLKLEK